MKTKGFTFPEELIPGLASGEITMVCLPVKQLAGFQDAKSVHPDGSGNGWIAWSGNTSAKETKRLYPGKQGFMPPLTVGDTLAVKETFYVQPFLWYDDHDPQPVHYARDIGSESEVEDYIRKQSNHMPLWACRIFRPVTGVKVARIKDVTEEECEAMGFKSTHKFNTVHNDYEGLFARDLFYLHLSEANPGSWDSNDYFWIYTLGEPVEAK